MRPELLEALKSLGMPTLRKIFGNPLKLNFEKLTVAYQAHGLSVVAPSEPAPFSETMVCAVHDGVPYCMDCHDDESDIPRGILHRQLMIDRHHALIKEIQAWCTQKTGGPVWVLCGGGSQMSAFFGNSTGYLALLYLSHVDLLGKPDMASYHKSLRSRKYTLQVQWDHNDKFFRGFKHADINKRTSASSK